MAEISVKRKRSPPVLLTRHYNEDTAFELCIDEAGRGCLFGRVYIACVVLPKEPELFDGKNIKDSKKFSSKKKLNEVAEYIKTNALAWHVAYVNSEIVDEINILKAVMQGMHECIRNIIEKIKIIDNTVTIDKCMAVIDGNYFTPYRAFDNNDNTIHEMPHITIEQGDAKFMGIAAASILAKTARDNYVLELCKEYPILVDRYGLDSNMGYGTKKHLDGIREHGITQWHRRTFGEACKNALKNDIV
jgi:ribonuclease HII